MEKSHPGLVFPKMPIKAETQEAMLREAGALHIVHVRGSWRGLFRGVRVIRPGDTVYFVALVFVPMPRGEDELPPALQAQEFVHELERTGAVGIEVHTGRRTDKKDDRRAMVKTAASSLRQGKRKPPAGFKVRGRPPTKIKPEWLKMWKSLDYATNADALEAMGNPFGMTRAIALFGPSGRSTGARKR